MNDQLERLERRLADAQAAGNSTLADMLEERITELTSQDVPAELSLLRTKRFAAIARGDKATADALLYDIADRFPVKRMPKWMRRQREGETSTQWHVRLRKERRSD